MKKTTEVIRVYKAISSVDKGISVMDVVTRAIFNNEIKIGKKAKLFDRDYSRDNKKSVSLTLDVLFTYDDMELNEELNYFDKAVHDAICGLWYNDIHEFSSEYIYRMMTGKVDGQANIDMKKIEDSIIRLNSMRVNLDCKNKNGDDILTINDNLLSIEQCRVIIKNGIELDGWKLLSEPALYKYAKTKKRIQCFKLELINTPLRFTDDNVKLIKFLFDRVLFIKTKVRKKDGQLWDNFKNCNNIRYTKLYELLNTDTNDRSNKACIKRKRMSDKCEKLFDFWINQAGILKDWVYISEKEKKVGYKLNLNLDGFKELMLGVDKDGNVVERTYEDVEFIDGDYEDWEEFDIQ